MPTDPNAPSPPPATKRQPIPGLAPAAAPKPTSAEAPAEAQGGAAMAAGPQPAGEGPNIRGPVTLGLAVIFLFFGIFGAWAALAPLQSAAVAPGVVSVDSSRKTVQHLEGGIVSEIKVREGDEVQAGQILIKLQEVQAMATSELLRGRLITAASLQARLEAERLGRDQIAFPDWLTAETDDAKAKEVMASQYSIFEARRESLRGQVAILEQRIAQFDEEIGGLQGQIAAEDRQIRLIAEEVRDLQKLVKKGLARRPRLLELERQAAEIQGSRHQNQARLARVRQQIGEAKLRISELQTERDNEIVEELREVQSELLDLTERMRAASDVLSRTEIRAPISGTVVGLQVHTAGGVIAPRERLMDIVPSEDSLIVEARVNPIDIDVVRQGLAARVLFSAFSQRNQLPLDGIVTSVSADSLLDERSGESYYLARIALTGDFRAILDGAELTPGMQADVIIVTGERTALQYLMKPLVQSFNRALREE
ncbi:MAG: HlyD family type I secretion periplasmic adaptor subunit [Kiloniellales bacterium]|nr:HlyD family type I secretion periplasmic adaptor subunit [Kiloniellales bacterium]